MRHIQDQDVNYSLIRAVREGRLERVRELISSHRLSYSKAWSNGYVLLCEAIKNRHAEVAKLLLTKRCKVNSKNSYISPTNTPLHFAVRNGGIEIVQMLLDRRADINAKNKFGKTPLHMAIEEKKQKITELFLNHRADTNIRDNMGRSPLDQAVEVENLQMVVTLLENGANVNSVCTTTWRKGYAPLHFAVEKGSKKVVNLFLSKAANVDVKGEDGMTPLHIAAKQGFIGIAEDLLNHGASTHFLTLKEKYTPLHFAVEKCSKAITLLLLSRGANIDVKGEDGMTPLHIAAKKGFEDIAEDLLKHGASTHFLTLKKSYTPLHFAVEKCSIAITLSLLRAGANVDIKGENDMTPLHVSAKTDCKEIIEILLRHAASTRSLTLMERYTPLHFAAELGNEEVVHVFLNRGANINSSTKENLTPLLIATKKGHESVVRLLLQHGAKVDHQDIDGKTILHHAVEKRHLIIVKDILKYCPDINNKSNRSSLKTAVFGSGEEYKQIVETLLEYGFIVNPSDTNNPVLLHTAVKKGYYKIVEELLKYGADVNTLNDSTYEEGFTPLHTATKYKQEEVARLLVSYGADINTQDKTGKTPIFYSIENSDVKITKLLLSNKAIVRDDPELLNTAVQKGCIEIVKALLNYDADINASDKYGRTALHFTALSGRENVTFFDDSLYPEKELFVNIMGKIAKLLLSKGANVEAQTKDGQTTLQIASQTGYGKVVEALLEYNANINFGVSTTPLHYFAERGNEKICKLLLNKGVNVNAKQNNKFPALHYAIQNGYIKVVKLLLERGAKVEYKVKGATPLHLGAEKGYLEIVKTLLKFGADVNSIDEYGQTALHIASSKEYAEIVTTLLEYGCDINVKNKDRHTALSYIWDPEFMDLQFWPWEPSETVETLIRHIVKMEAANFSIGDNSDILDYIKSTIGDEIKGFQDICEQEIASMKSEKINNTNISFYDILKKGTNSLALCMRNKNIVQTVKLNNYEKKFPIYASMIKCHFSMGMERNKLIEQGKKIFHSLPLVCSEKIFSYLSDKDLKNFNSCLYNL